MTILLLLVTVLGHSTASSQVAHAQTSSTVVPSSDFNFASAGDWGCKGETTETVNNIVDKTPELVLGLGDFSYGDDAGCWLEIVY
jgi:phosphodiesterase/alkaline phosphatase D-like protein